MNEEERLKNMAKRVDKTREKLMYDRAIRNNLLEELRKELREESRTIIIELSEDTKHFIKSIINRERR